MATAQEAKKTHKALVALSFKVVDETSTRRRPSGKAKVAHQRECLPAMMQKIASLPRFGKMRPKSSKDSENPPPISSVQMHGVTFLQDLAVVIAFFGRSFNRSYTRMKFALVEAWDPSPDEELRVGDSASVLGDSLQIIAAKTVRADPSAADSALI